MVCKRCLNVNTKLTDLINLTNLCYLKTYELKALDCLLEATSASFLHRNLTDHYNFIM
ncbi:hypothetical protein COD85_00915 [Bacillus thuringiensis]|nr:hypothetical protein COD85_00915 [Bacillus thuringiensis]